MFKGIKKNHTDGLVLYSTIVHSPREGFQGRAAAAKLYTQKRCYADVPAAGYHQWRHYHFHYLPRNRTAEAINLQILQFL